MKDINKINKKCKAFTMLSMSIISFILIFALSSCYSANSFSGDGHGDKINLSIIYCNRQNSNAGLDTKETGNYIYDALSDANNTQINFITCDGTPTLTRSIDLNESWKGSDDGSSTNVKNFNKKHTKEMIDFLKNEFNANDEESDIVSALSLANSKFKDKDNGKENVVLICDSGISTKGYLNFQTINNTNINPVDYITKIKLPKLNKIHKVIWYGFNECDNEKQKPINATLEEQTKNILEAKLKESGIETIEWENGEKNKTEKNNLPKVTPIKFNDVSDIVNDFESGNTDTIDLSESVIQFKPDSTEFVNETNASAILLNISDMLKKNNDINIVIKGFIAAKDIDTFNLSQKRADKVRDKLVEQGASTNQIRAIGMGKGPYPYLKEDGSINEQNRFIRIERT